jgi:hypothetical protein
MSDQEETEELCACGTELPEQDSDGEVEIEGWLVIDNTCKSCGKRFCHDCLLICMECFNQNEEHDILCDNCGDPEEFTDCESCGWMLCKQHAEACGNCRAGKNFDLRYSLGDPPEKLSTSKTVK